MRSSADSPNGSRRFLILILATIVTGGAAACRETTTPESPPPGQEAPEPPRQEQRTAPGATRWEEAISRFEEQDRENPPTRGAALFLGSSSIRLWDLARFFPGTETINRGFGGSQVSDVLRFTPRIVIPYEPRIVFFYAGDNDIAAGKPASRVLRDFSTFVQSVHSALPKTRIVFIAIKPSLSRWQLVDEMRRANRLIHDLSMTDERLDFVDIDAPMIGNDRKPRREFFAEDGLHLNDNGYELWTELVRPFLE